MIAIRDRAEDLCWKVVDSPAKLAVSALALATLTGGLTWRFGWKRGIPPVMVLPLSGLALYRGPYEMPPAPEGLESLPNGDEVRAQAKQGSYGEWQLACWAGEGKLKLQLCDQTLAKLKKIPDSRRWQIDRLLREGRQLPNNLAWVYNEIRYVRRQVDSMPFGVVTPPNARHEEQRVAEALLLAAERCSRRDGDSAWDLATWYLMHADRSRSLMDVSDKKAWDRFYHGRGERPEGDPVGVRRDVLKDRYPSFWVANGELYKRVPEGRPQGDIGAPSWRRELLLTDHLVEGEIENVRAPYRSRGAEPAGLAALVTGQLLRHARVVDDRLWFNRNIWVETSSDPIFTGDALELAKMLPRLRPDTWTECESLLAQHGALIGRPSAREVGGSVAIDLGRPPEAKVASSGFFSRPEAIDWDALNEQLLTVSSALDRTFLTPSDTLGA